MIVEDSHFHAHLLLLDSGGGINSATPIPAPSPPCSAQVMIHGWAATNPNYGRPNAKGIKDPAKEIYESLVSLSHVLMYAELGSCG